MNDREQLSAGPCLPIRRKLLHCDRELSKLQGSVGIQNCSLYPPALQFTSHEPRRNRIVGTRESDRHKDLGRMIFLTIRADK
jgi:hypothetical protein